MILRKFFIVIVVLALTVPSSRSLGQDAADWPGPSAQMAPPPGNSSSVSTAGAGIIGNAIGGVIGGALNRHGSKSKRATRPPRSSTKGRRIRNKAIQKALNAVGFNAGPVDGVFGRKTHKAIKAFQTSISKKPTGKLTALETSMLFRKAYPRPVYDIAPPEKMNFPALPETLPAMPKKLDFPPVQSKENSTPTDN